MVSRTGTWITKARNRKGLSIPQLAELVGTNRSHMWAIEVGNRTPRKELANKIAGVLEADVGNFLRDHSQNEHDDEHNTA